MIRQNVNLQARLIDDLLDVMRIVRGKMPLHWEIADGHDLIHQAVQICRSEFLGKGLRLTLELGAPRHHLNADPARLQQVLWNLIKNAVKFTPSGGTITIRTRNQENDDPRGDCLIIDVADTGHGVEPELLPRVFDAFQQGESSITQFGRGQGWAWRSARGSLRGMAASSRPQARARNGERPSRSRFAPCRNRWSRTTAARTNPWRSSRVDQYRFGSFWSRMRRRRGDS